MTTPTPPESPSDNLAAAVAPTAEASPAAPPAVAEGTLTATGLIRPHKASTRYIWLLVLAQFGIFVSLITPIAISLAVRVSSLAPGRDEYLGYILGAGSFVVMIITPIVGVLSDRTRTKLGRRRPWMLGGMLLGVVSLFVMGLAPNVLILGFGWVLAQMGWGQALAMVTTSMADTLPEQQRGKVAGFVGFATQVAPVVGVVLAGGLAGNHSSSSSSPASLVSSC